MDKRESGQDEKWTSGRVGKMKNGQESGQDGKWTRGRVGKMKNGQEGEWAR